MRKSIDTTDKRIVVIGTSCMGKTTLSMQLAKLLDSKHVHLDAIYWKPNWQERPKEEFRQLVENQVEDERWVADGNYSVVRDILWGRATTLIWLNYSFGTVTKRALTRTIWRSATKQDLFSGNRETFRKSFFSSDSILLWVLKTYSRNRNTFPQLFQEQRFANLKIIELQNPRQCEQMVLELMGENNVE